MRIGVNLLACGLLLGVSAHAECRLDRVASLPITDTGTKIRVAATVNGQPANFVFDTGSETTAITEEAAARLDLKPVAPEHGFGNRGQFIGIGGARRARPMEARTVDLGGLRARDFGFLVIDAPMRSDGLLSSDLLAKYDIDLDLPGRHVNLFYPHGDCAHPSAFLHGNLYSVPLLPISRDRGPQIRITINGIPLTAQVDTGAGGTALFRSGAERLRLDMARIFADARGTAGGIGPARVRAASLVLTDVQIGDLGLDRLPVRVLDSPSLGSVAVPVDMLLGADFLTAVHVWISYSSGTLIMQVPAAPSPAIGPG